MVVTNRGMMIRTVASQISLLGRATQGVRVISMGEDESVASVARIAEPEGESEGDAPEESQTES